MTADSPVRTPFSVLNQSVVPNRVLALLLDPHMGFSGDRKMVLYSHLSKRFPKFVMIHTVKGFSIVGVTEIDAFLKFSCLLYNPASAGNLISSSSFFSKPSLDIWKFLVFIMLKPTMEDFKHDLTSMREECNSPKFLAHSLVLAFLGIGIRIDLFQSCGTAGSSKFADIMNAKP